MRITLRSSSHGERIAVQMLRIARRAGQSACVDAERLGIRPDLADAFVKLVTRAETLDLHVLADGAPFLSEGEVRLIGGIALRQRGLRWSTEIADDLLDQLMLACANGLTVSGIRLPPACTQRPVFLDRPVHSQARGEAAPRLEQCVPREGKQLKVLARELAIERGVAPASAFYVLGISRRYLSQLVHTGSLERAGPGLYRAGRLPSQLV